MELIRYYLYLIAFTLISTQTIVDDFLNGIPVSATSQDSTQVTKDLLTDQSISECVCDITTFSCDQFCCCDPLCPPLEKEKWTNSSLCSDTQLQPYNYNCIDRNLVYRFNQRRGISESINANGDPCYTLDNDRYLSSFYLTLDDVKNQDKTINLIFTDYSENILLRNTQKNFTQPPERILANYLGGYSGGVQTFVVNNKFGLFSKGPDGSCISGKMIRFMEDYSVSCWMKVNETDCDRFDSSVVIGTVIDGVTPTIKIPITPIDACTDFPSSMEFVMIRDSKTNMINSVEVSYVTQGGIDALKVLPVTFSVRFLNDITVAASRATDVATSQSAIGYKNGSPLLFKGTFSPIISDSDGKCISTSSPSNKQFIFGGNTQVSCYVSEPNADEFCTSLQGSLYAKMLDDKLEIGSYSNSDPTNATQWLPPLTAILSADICSFTPSGTTTTVTYASSIILKLTTTNTGYQYSPLNKILKAEIVLVKEIFTWPSTPTYSRSVTFQVKYLKAKTSGGVAKDNLLPQNPPMPTILPWLPTNIIDPLTKVDY